jgi:tripartite ATP-independent transporter DctP family solute receptor
LHYALFKRGAVLALLALACRTAAAAEYQAAENQPADYPTVQALEFMAKLIKQRSGGRVSITVVPGAKLGDEKKTLALNQEGKLAFNRVSLAILTDSIPETRVLTMPFLFRNSIHMHKVVDGPIGDEILRAFDAQGLVGLAWYDSGGRSFYTARKPIRGLEDLKGLKIRVQQSDLFVAMIQALGAQPVAMAYGDVYNALKTGAVDGAENNWPSFISSRHYEVAKFYSLTEHTRAPEAVIMSKAVYATLSPADQAIVRQAARESVAQQRALWDAFEARSIKTAQDSGVEVTEMFLAIDRLPFYNAVKPVYARFLTTEKLRNLEQRIRHFE